MSKIGIWVFSGSRRPRHWRPEGKPKDIHYKYLHSWECCAPRVGVGGGSFRLLYTVVTLVSVLAQCPIHTFFSLVVSAGMQAGKFVF